MRFKSSKLIPLTALLLLLLLFYLLDLDQFLTLSTLRTHRNLLQTYVDQHAVLAPLLFILASIIAIALSIPGGAILTVTGGFLFGSLSTCYMVGAATIGASIIFLIARITTQNTPPGPFILKTKLSRRTCPRLEQLAAQMKEHQAALLLFVRLVPLFPFWLINLAPAYLGVRFITYLWTTFLGIIPGTWVYTQAGIGIDSLFAQGNNLTFKNLFTPQIRLAFFMLSLLTFLPIAGRLVLQRIGTNKAKTDRHGDDPSS